MQALVIEPGDVLDDGRLELRAGSPHRNEIRSLVNRDPLEIDERASPAMSKQRLKFLVASMSFNLHREITAQWVDDCYNCAHGSLPGCVSHTNCAGLTGLKQLRSQRQGRPPA